LWRARDRHAGRIPAGRLGDFLRDHREEILAAWERAVRTMGAARNLSRPVLLDHMSEFIDDLVAEALLK